MNDSQFLTPLQRQRVEQRAALDTNNRARMLPKALAHLRSDMHDIWRQYRDHPDAVHSAHMQYVAALIAQSYTEMRRWSIVLEMEWAHGARVALTGAGQARWDRRTRAEMHARNADMGFKFP